MNLLPYNFHGTATYYDKQWQAPLQELGIKPESNWPKTAIGNCVSDSSRVKCYRIESFETAYYKTYYYRDEWYKYFMRPSKCATEFYTYSQMKKIGIPCPSVIAFGERRRLGFLCENFIVTTAIENSSDLEDFAFNTWRHLPAGQKKKAFDQIFEQTARYTALAHKNSLFHYDLKWRNILIQPNGEDKWTTYWIDSPRGRVKAINKSRGVIVDLSALARLALSYLSLTQRYRFLCQYLGVRGGSQVKALFREVEAHLSRRPPKPVQFN